MTALTWDENDERLNISIEKKRGAKIAAKCLGLAGSLLLMFSLITTVSNDLTAFLLLGSMGFTSVIAATIFLMVSQHYNNEQNQAIAWQESYRKAIADMHTLPIESLRKLCESFDISGDPYSCKLQFEHSNAEFLCKFSFDEFKEELLEITGKTYEEILQYSPKIIQANYDGLSELPPLAY